MADLRLAIIADDLTGALDTAAPFTASPGGVVVATRPEALRVALDRRPAVVAVSTRSREMPARAAREAVAATLAMLPPGAAVLKKIDSRLKGNVAAELSAFQGPLTVLPAIPEFGRVVSDGALRGFGVETPLPVRDVLGDAAARATVPDAETDAQLSEALAAAPEDAVLVGARGLAQALAARWGLGAPPPAELPAPVCFAIGSTDPITRAQVDALRADRPTTAFVAAPAGRVPPPPDDVPDIAVVATTEGDETRPATVACTFAHGLVPWIRSAHGALLTGGATAEAVLDALGVFRLSLIGEALPGLPAARSGRWVFVTKSGGFGQPDALLRLAPGAQRAEV
ncbi:four-carbon acid sugar kinase family protein [Psychromarinibacter sp. C21-152]|uniref:Four-carbon acid sugar kinase family protein n=1 Tax=Psychromarinibacter sediminicola TaxID=3033385 RepID=A0AAE3T973_9RHOB|nr:four-carbon acid sugar kinase family protein [Psychromarinibacter sediminicola]MDF0600280.1 four-carbon acid sugar kinase family protein [Psychromarinibacter sediminicola]